MRRLAITPPLEETAAPVCTLDSAGLSAGLEDIIARGEISTLFQPIADIRGRGILGYEALSRGPSDSCLHSPSTLFDAAFRVGRLFELELLCREVSLRRFQQLKLPGKLFLNVTPMSLSQFGHRSSCTAAMLEDIGLAPEQVVIELTEQHPLGDYAIMRQAVQHYRAQGFQIAIDDLGGGYAGLRMWSELRPEYVKIDRHFVQRINEDTVKQEFVRSIIDIARGLACCVIAEGIETEDEFQCVSRMGVTVGQGYYFSRPQSLPPVTLSPTLFQRAANSGTDRPGVRLTESVASLLRDAPSLAPETRLQDVVDLFSSSPALLSMPVIDPARVPLGMVRRHQILDLYATNYGRALHGKQPVTAFMDRQPLIVEREMSVEQVSQMVTENMQLRLEEEFIITDKGSFAGLGRVVDLLRKITELQVRNARYANPLTLLPGNVPIYEALEKQLAAGNTFVVAYCDLDNFKPFNDVYGYSKGDQVIQRLAEIVTAEVDRELDFAGHVGGDDFILVMTSVDWQRRCERVLEEFHRGVDYFYSVQDRQQGGISSSDRSGRPSFYPMLSLSIGVVKPEPGACISHHEVAAMATEAKHQAKQQPGNSLYVDRRVKPDQGSPALPLPGIARPS